MSLRTYRILQAALLSGLAFLFLHRLWTGTLFYYINERFFPLVVFGALGFLVLIPFLLHQSRLSDGGHHDDPGHEDGRGESDHAHMGQRARVWSIAILAVPVMLGLLVPASPLGASAVSVKGIGTSVDTNAAKESRVSTYSTSSDERTVLDWLRAFNFTADPLDLNGENADVVGFVFRDERLRQDEFMVGRFTLTCCVADASAIGLVVRWPEAESLANNTWVRVEGKIEIVQVPGGASIRLRADRVEQVEEPAQPYLFP